MPYDHLLVHKRDKVAIVTINRPGKMNSLNAATRRELLRCFEELKHDDPVPVAVITGSFSPF